MRNYFLKIDPTWNSKFRFNTYYQISKCDKINNVDYSKYISESGTNIKLDDFSAFPINLGTFDNTVPLIKLNDEKNEFFLNDEATFLFTNKKIKNESIKFIFKNSKSKLIIHGEFENIDFNFSRDFNDKNLELSDIRYDKNLLTGCVNFFESKFKNVNITGENMVCEDAVNIKIQYIIFFSLFKCIKLAATK